MNIFRLSGDLAHLLAIFILLVKIWRSRSCAGVVILLEIFYVDIVNYTRVFQTVYNGTPVCLERARGLSGKSQILFAVVFSTRYLDLFVIYISAYNTVMKLIFIFATYVTVYLIYVKFRTTYSTDNDTFRAEFLLIPALGLAFLVNHEMSVLEVLWTFSIYLESVAILPQLFMLNKTGEAETITSHYLFALGLYRALYIVNWIYRYYTENFFDLIMVVAGCVQTVLYCDFFYLYITKVLRGKSLVLPV